MLNRSQQSGRETGIDILGDVSWESKYKTLLENLPQKIFLKDTNSVYISCNENYARDLKIKAEDIAGKTDYDFFTPSSTPAISLKSLTATPCEIGFDWV